MIKIFYNPLELELVYTIASLVLAKSHTEYLLFMPMETKDLMSHKKDDYSISKLSLDNNEETEAVLSELADDDNEKIILLKIYPKNNDEKIIITNFFDQYEPKISLWLDNHVWDEELLKYLGNNPKLFINPEYSCGQLLLLAGYLMPDCWSEAEIALIKKDKTNELSNRYFRAWMVQKVISINLTGSTILLHELFVSIISELIQTAENYYISQLAELFYDMTKGITWAKKNFSTNNPIFTQANKLGRTVGYLACDEVQEYFDINSIVNIGTERFPWLCIVEFSLHGRNQIALGSKKLPIYEILESYQNINTPLDSYLLMQLINAELLKL